MRPANGWIKFPVEGLIQACLGDPVFWSLGWRKERCSQMFLRISFCHAAILAAETAEQAHRLRTELRVVMTSFSGFLQQNKHLQQQWRHPLTPSSLLQDRDQTDHHTGTWLEYQGLIWCVQARGRTDSRHTGESSWCNRSGKPDTLPLEDIHLCTAVLCSIADEKRECLSLMVSLSKLW